MIKNIRINPKSISFICFLLIFMETSGQQMLGFESLAFAKTSLESIVKQYGANIPDTSAIFKHYYLPLSKAYNEAKANYSAFLGGMKNCILNYDSKGRVKRCLEKKTLNIQSDLQTMKTLFDSAYLIYYINIHPQTTGGIKPHNNGAITASTITSILSTLVDAGIKLWDEIQKKNKQFKDDYLSNLGSKDYVLSDFDDLLKQAQAKK